MDTHPAFGADRYVIELGGAVTRSISLEPLMESDASRLGEAFAAIDPWASYAYPASALAEYFIRHEPGAPRFALTVAGEIAGAVGLRLAWLQGPYIQLLGLLPAFQRKGFGHAVLAWIEEEARNGNTRNLWVVASQINHGGIRFYERCGFVQVAQLDGLAFDGRMELLLRKRL